MKPIAAFVVLAVCVAGGAFSSPPARAEPLYRYCVIGTPNMPRSCTYSTLQQCQVSASAGAGFCQENNAYVAARNSGVGTRTMRDR